MKAPEIGPWWIAATIVGTVAIVLMLFLLDSGFDTPPFEVDEQHAPSDYSELLEKHILAYNIWVVQERRAHFDWHLRSTKYLFWISMLVTVSGISFAFWQFAKANQFDAAERDHDTLDVRSQLASLSFKSRSTASLVLFVSIAYLIVYVAFVYPIQFAQDGQAGSVRQPALLTNGAANLSPMDPPVPIPELDSEPQPSTEEVTEPEPGFPAE